MSEAPQGAEQPYKELSFQQLNVELNKLYQSLPEPAGDEEYMDKLFKSSKVIEVSIMEEWSNDRLLSHPEYVSNAELDQLKRKVDGIMDERKKSESKRELENRLRSLLAYCKGTSAFKEYLISEFGSMYIYGIDKDNPGVEDERVFRKFQVDDTESGGIFDEKNIQVLEKVAFNHVYYTTLSLHSLHEQAERFTKVLQGVSKLLGEEREVPSADHLIRRDRAMLRRWQQQYQDRYGISPLV